MHGGLNSTEDTAGRISEMLDPMLADGYYPIFISWRSSGLSSYRDHLWSVRHGRKSSSARITAIPYLAADLFGVVANAPVAWVSEMTNSIDSVRGKYTRNIPYDELQEKYSIHYNWPEDDPSSSLGRTLGWWATAPLKLVTTPVTHTMGKSPWVVMNRRALTTLYTEETIDSGEAVQVMDLLKSAFGAPAETEDVVSAEYRGTAFRLLDMLQRLDADGSLRDAELTLIGHSMGVIVANHFLIAMPGLAWTRIVHMASADSISNFYNRLIPYLRVNADTRYYALFLHPDNEDREVNKNGLVPSGSLLVWVDNMYTTPATMVDRTAGRFTNFWPVYSIAYPDLRGSDPRDRMIFTVFDQRGSNGNCEQNTISLNPGCIPQKHGHFTRTRFWEPAFYDPRFAASAGSAAVNRQAAR